MEHLLRGGLVDQEQGGHAYRSFFSLFEAAGGMVILRCLHYVYVYFGFTPCYWGANRGHTLYFRSRRVCCSFKIGLLVGRNSTICMIFGI